MPGVSVVVGRDALPAGAVADALETARFADDYRVETLLDCGGTVVGWSGYDAYPLTRHETDDWALFLEGKLYAPPAADRAAELVRVAEWVAGGEDEDLDGWIRTCDGDFLLVAVEKSSGEAFVLTDAFARLPVYRARVGGAAVVSREMGVVRSLAAAAGEPVGADRLGVAQTLLFGYRLGDRTLFDGVECLPPATRLRVGGRRTRVFRHDFGSHRYAGDPVQSNARLLAGRFLDACERRAGDGPVVVSLSGGLDSRAVLAGCTAAGVDARAATFDRAGGATGDDVRAARDVAAVLGRPWQSYRVAATAAAEDWLLETKHGMNSLGTAFVVDFLDRLVEDRGRDLTLLTGDGGDKALPDLSPPGSFRDVHDLTDRVVRGEAVVDPADAAAAAGVAESRLRDSVARRLAGYPERSPGDRYVHFSVRERGINWLNHGEDRNRYFCWCTTPFYGLPFFDDAMNCPPVQKAHGGLYRAFLNEIGTGVERVEYADFGAAPTSPVYTLKRAAYEEVARYPRLKTVLLDAVRNGDADEEVRRRLRTLLATTSLDAALDPEVVERLLDGGSLSGGGAYDALTIARVAGALPTADDGT